MPDWLRAPAALAKNLSLSSNNVMSDNSQPPITPVAGHPMPSSGILRQRQTHSIYTQAYMHICMYIHKIYNKYINICIYIYIKQTHIQKYIIYKIYK